MEPNFFRPYDKFGTINKIKMPASKDKAFYDLLDSIADSTNHGKVDAVQQNKRIKEAQIAEDSAEPNAEQLAYIHREVEDGRHHGNSEQRKQPGRSQT